MVTKLGYTSHPMILNGYTSHPMMLNAAAALLSFFSVATASSTALHSTANMLQPWASAAAINCWYSAFRASKGVYQQLRGV